MCFDLDSAPPIPELSGGALAHEDLVLAAADGATFAAFAALPEAPSDAGVVILPDVRGLYHFYEELALRFAERGYAAIAIDYFGRTAGTDKRDDDFEYRPHVEQTTEDGVKADTRAAAEWLRAQNVKSVFTVGFCFGGRNSWLAATWDLGLKGAVGFYGRPDAVIPKAGEIAVPILALQAGADANISHEDNAAFEAALTNAGVEHELIEYDGAPHSFFDRKQEEFADASADAWQRTLDFIERNR
ncbi:MAG: dienelactone hydrolase family protein [Gaiellaceae bacterium]